MTTTTSENETLSRATLLTMAIAAGVSVANIYYNQPLLEQIRTTFDVSFTSIGWVPTLTQVGYAFGMLLLVPLGDMFDRKKLVLIFSVLASICAAAMALAPQFPLVAIASFVLGLTTVAPQLLIPFAATLAKPNEKGKVVGTMMSGLLLGILLARTVSGFVGASFGWRVMFGLASGVLLILATVLYFVLPNSQPSYKGRYVGLLQSVYKIFREQPVLREAGLFGAMLFGSFSAFWATLIHLLETPAFNLGARAVGLFGLLGAAAALLSPVIGSIMDRRNPRTVSGLMIALTIFSFLVFGLSSTSLIGLAIGVILMDIGVQSGHISNQSRIFALLPNAQSRIQTAYMFFYFAGGALGSFLATWAWGNFAWTGVCAVAIAMLLIALIRFLLPAPGPKVPAK